MSVWVRPKTHPPPPVAVTPLPPPDLDAFVAAHRPVGMKPPPLVGEVSAPPVVLASPGRSRTVLATPPPLSPPALKQSVLRLSRPKSTDPRPLSPYADASAVDHNGRGKRRADGALAEHNNVPDVFHAMERGVLLGVPKLGHGELADCLDRLSRQSEIQRTTLQRDLEKRFLAPIGVPPERANSPPRPRTELEASAAAMYDRGLAQMEARRKARDRNNDLVEKRNSRYVRIAAAHKKKTAGVAADDAEALEAAGLSERERALAARLYREQRARAAAAAAKLAERYVAHTGPAVVKLPKAAVAKAVERLAGGQ